MLATTDSAEFDGVRPVKVHHQLSLEGNLVAIVVNAPMLVSSTSPSVPAIETA